MHRDMLGDCYDGPYTGMCFLHDRIGGSSSRHKDDASRNIMIPHRFLHGIVDRDTMDFLTPFTRRHTCHDTAPTDLPGIGIHQPDVELALFSRGPLHEDSRLSVPVDHEATSTAFLTTRSIVSSIS